MREHVRNNRCLPFRGCGEYTIKERKVTPEFFDNVFKPKERSQSVLGIILELSLVSYERKDRIERGMAPLLFLKGNEREVARSRRTEAFAWEALMENPSTLSFSRNFCSVPELSLRTWSCSRTIEFYLFR